MADVISVFYVTSITQSSQTDNSFRAVSLQQKYLVPHGIHTMPRRANRFIQFPIIISKKSYTPAGSEKNNNYEMLSDADRPVAGVLANKVYGIFIHLFTAVAGPLTRRII